MRSKTPPSDSFFNQFSKSYLFQGLEQEKIRTVFSIAKEINLNEGEFLMREGEEAHELYVLIEGELGVSRYESEQEETYALGAVGPGETVGEVSLLDHGERSASVQAKSNSRLICIPFQKLTTLIEQNPALTSLYMHMSENIGKRLRSTNDIAMKAMKEQLVESRTRTKMAGFLIAIITGISVYIFAIPQLQYLLRVVPNSTLITLPLTSFMAIILFLLKRYFKTTWEELGVTKKNLKRSLLEGFFFTLPVLGIGAVLKWFLIEYEIYIEKRPFFDPYSMFPNPETHIWQYWVLLNASYWFIMVPLQELLSRGGLQGLLEKFLVGKNRVGLSILMSNLIFASAHIFFSTAFAFTTLITGVFFGWLYARTHNLAGPSLSHAIMGTFGFSVLGMSGFFF